MNYKIVTLVSISALFLVGLSPVYAAGKETNCSNNYGSYGNNANCDQIDFVVNKTIADPTTVGLKGQNPSNYQDNWGINANKYVPGQQVPFKISVTNTGTVTLTNITVKDSIPQFLSYASGGTYDKKTNTVSFTISKLAPNETKTVELVAQVIAADKFSANETAPCTTNTAIVSANGIEGSDSAMLCITKESTGGPSETKGGTKVFPAPKTKTTPPTGPEVLALLPLIGSGIAGLLLRKKSV